MITVDGVSLQTTVVESFADVDVSSLKAPLIAVFSRPEDYLDKCVARLFDREKATNIVIIRDSVEELRGDIHFTFWGMVPISRGADDAKSLVEVWM